MHSSLRSATATCLLLLILAVAACDSSAPVPTATASLLSPKPSAKPVHSMPAGLTTRNLCMEIAGFCATFPMTDKATADVSGAEDGSKFAVKSIIDWQGSTQVYSAQTFYKKPVGNLVDYMEQTACADNDKTVSKSISFVGRPALQLTCPLKPQGSVQAIIVIADNGAHVIAATDTKGKPDYWHILKESFSVS